MSDPEAMEKDGQRLAGRIYPDLLREACVLFLGAGATTERRGRDSRSFYNSIRHQSTKAASEESLSFPAVMEIFCKELDGGQKNLLIREAIRYIEDFCLPGDQNRIATMVPELVAQIPYFSRIVTTNWDPFLERSLDVLIPIVEDKDLPFWDDKKRQILKIHGCISRPYTLVATETDYASCISANPLVFNKLRDMMTTKTFIFSGYSMRDSDFREVWHSITERLGKFGRLAYWISPNATDDDEAYWRARGVEVFRTTDVSFLRALREQLQKNDEIPSQEFIEEIKEERRRIVRIHLKNNQKSTGQFASAMYQDGLLHSIDDILSSLGLGTKLKSDFENDRREARKQIQTAREEDDFIEIAYWTGRFVAVDQYCSRDMIGLPAYIHPNTLNPIARQVFGEAFSETEMPSGEESGPITDDPSKVVIEAPLAVASLIPSTGHRGTG